MPDKLSPDIIERIIAMRMQGCSILSIAVELDVSEVSAYRYGDGLRPTFDRGVARSKAHLFDRVVRLREAGFTYKVIEHDAGVSRTTACKWMKLKREGRRPRLIERMP